MNITDHLTQHQGATAGRPFAASIARLPFRFRPGAEPGTQMTVHVATTGPEPGNWLVTVDGSSCHVSLGSITTPSARLYTSSEIGCAILDGALSVREALASRLLDYDGDPEELRRFRASFRLEDAL